MKTKAILFFVLFLGMIPCMAVGQLTETYFSDIEVKEGGKIYDHIKDGNNIIIAGRSYDDIRFMPSVIKIDTLGNTIWSTTANDSNSYSGTDAFIAKLMLSDNYIYATCIMQVGTSATKEIWKIDASNGNIIWKKPFFTYSTSRPEHIIDYDVNKFLVGFTNAFIGLGYETKFVFIDKITLVSDKNTN